MELTEHTEDTDHQKDIAHPDEPPTTKSITEILFEEEGAATAEYAIVIMAAVALAGVLVAIMRSGEVQAMLLELVQKAFGAAG